MKRLCILMLCVLGGACNKHNPVAPSPTPMQTAVVSSDVVVKPIDPTPIILAGGDVYTGPLHHNIPFIMPDGVTPAWLCETKPRRYVLKDGTVEYTLDHYSLLGQGGCPDIPID